MALADRINQSPHERRIYGNVKQQETTSCVVLPGNPRYNAFTIRDAVISTIFAHGLQGVAEYYWHRILHIPALYKRFHRYHHYYVSPEIFDDMMIHPLEAFGYYFILFSPSQICLPRFSFAAELNWQASYPKIGFSFAHGENASPFPEDDNNSFRWQFFYPGGLTVWVWVGYMALCGVTGIMDHSGIRWTIPGIYDTRDHDAHHQYVNVNYAFPFPFLDMLHGTYRGEFLGRMWRPCYAVPRARADGGGETIVHGEVSSKNE
ncbi:hypothetical protein M427DRAFT_440739 [Gonapodya prolifera JEL478]|uniref:Fatty acid hydroxylase domain-containing protein n=1 Tax=Gonapodya prolifera (strain JEL478) TaxID=1344416 RepID=A0A139A3N8_GONPJ|nr:hypothetical protein M427DRAFT_440739 [Gonapodya prolifera JEL478]|eukprot:KXS11279.1 hypothetical protein M427DRAFT_440739 [Gonapodya prolifera JEL478]